MSSEGSGTGSSSFFKSFAAAAMGATAGTAVAWAVSGALSPQQFPALSPRSNNDFRAIEAGERRSLSSSNLGVEEYRSSSAWSPVDTVMKLFEMTNDMGSTVRKSPIAANRSSDYVSDESKSPPLAVNRPNTSESRTPVSQTIININIPKSPQPTANGRAGQTITNIRMKIADNLSNATYDCMICLEKIAKWSPVVACKRCHVISHLRCLHNYFSTATGKGYTPVCPTCREKLSSDLRYRCFCEKKINPTPVAGLTPHTCGAICGKKTSSGKSCELICHPGPCD